MRYLYIFEDGSLAQSQDSPTDLDYGKAAAGFLTVISVNESGVFRLHDDRDLRAAIVEAVLDDNNDDLGPYHTTSGGA